MNTKSVPQQVYDEFIKRLSEEDRLKQETVDKLKALISGGGLKRADIEELLKKEEETHENAQP